MQRSTMKAAVFEGVGKLAIKDVPVPALKEEDDLICEVELCSVCGTDVHIMEVPPGYTATREPSWATSSWEGSWRRAPRCAR